MLSQFPAHVTWKGKSPRFGYDDLKETLRLANPQLAILHIRESAPNVYTVRTASGQATYVAQPSVTGVELQLQE